MEAVIKSFATGSARVRGQEAEESTTLAHQGSGSGGEHEARASRKRPRRKSGSGSWKRGWARGTRVAEATCSVNEDAFAIGAISSQTLRSLLGRRLEQRRNGGLGGHRSPQCCAGTLFRGTRGDPQCGCKCVQEISSPHRYREGETPRCQTNWCVDLSRAMASRKCRKCRAPQLPLTF